MLIELLMLGTCALPGIFQERRPVPTLPERHTVTARVVDARGQPVAHAHVKTISIAGAGPRNCSR